MSRQYMIQSIATDVNGNAMAIDVTGAISPPGPTSLNVTAPQGADTQLWTFEESGTSGYFYIKSVQTVDVSGNQRSLAVNISTAKTPDDTMVLDTYPHVEGDQRQLWAIGPGQADKPNYYVTLRSQFDVPVNGNSTPLVVNIKGSGTPAVSPGLDVFHEVSGDSHQLWTLILPGGLPPSFNSGYSATVSLLPETANLGTEGQAPSQPQWSTPILVGTDFYPGAPVVISTSWDSDLSGIGTTGSPVTVMADLGGGFTVKLTDITEWDLASTASDSEVLIVEAAGANFIFGGQTWNWNGSAFSPVP